MTDVETALNRAEKSHSAAWARFAQDPPHAALRSDIRSAGNKPVENGAASGLSRNVTHWAVGVTSAPRSAATLGRTLASLARAGWDRPRLFVEPGVDMPGGGSAITPAQQTGTPAQQTPPHLPITRRDEPLGAFPNFYLSLAELVMRQPWAEAYFMVQDDVVLARGVREYLEHVLWPAEDAGVVSIYCPSIYAVGASRGFHLEDRGWRNWTAQTLIFSNPAARAFIADLGVVNHRHHGRADGMRNIDCVVGHWCRQSGRPFYVHAPSLAQHIGEASTLFAHARCTGIRVSTTFVGEDFDARRWLDADSADSPEDSAA